MALTPEKKVKNSVVRVLKNTGRTIFFRPVMAWEEVACLILFVVTVVILLA